MTSHRWLAAACAILGLAGCQAIPSVTPTPSASPTTGPSPSGAPIVLVRGTSSCSITSIDQRTEAGRDIIEEHFRCRYTVSDERLSGRVEADFTTIIEPSGAPTGRWDGTVRITNEAGSWEGPAQGALVFWPGRSGPYNYGQGVYRGSGAYAGLAYHELVYGTDTGLTVTGWIGPAE